MRVDATLRTLIFLIIVHAAVLVPGVPVVIRAALTLAFAVVAGWQFVAIFGLGETRPLDRFLYAVATSITALMLLGLIVNMLLPYIGVERPLQAATALVVLDCLLVAGMIAMFRNTEHKREVRERVSIPVSWPNALLWTIAATPVLLAAIGAKMLNSGGSPIVTGIAIVLAVLVVTACLVYGNKTSDATGAWILFCAALTFLWIGWLRSSFVSGVDINVEYHLFEHTLTAGRWSLAVFQDSYNACMSITILPTLLATLTGLGPTTIFKLVMPCLFALVPVATFVFLRRYVSTTLAIAGAAFVIAQHAYLLWWTIPVKQEVGLVLFSTLLLLVSDRDLKPATRFISIIIVGLGMVVAHYTTTYVSLALLLFTGVIVGIHRLIAKREVGRRVLTKMRLFSSSQQAQTTRTTAIPVLAILILMAATISWYGLITNTEGSTVASIRQVASSLGSVFDDDVRQAGALTSVFNPLAEPPNDAELLHTVATEVQRRAGEPGRYEASTYSEFSIESAIDVVTPLAVPSVVKQGAFALNEVMKTLIKVLMLIGVWLLLSKHLRQGDIEFEIVVLVLFAFLVLAAMLFLPFASIVYSVSRAYQQVALIVALAFALGVGAMVNLLDRIKLSPLSGLAIACILMIPILFYTGLVPLIVGGTSPTTMLANEGRNYDEVYTDRGEILAAQWIYDNSAVNAVYASSRAKEKLWLDGDFTLARSAEGVFPQSMHRDGYVFADSTNTVRGVGYASAAGTTVAYRYPLTFLEDQKNIIYSTATATVYR